MPALNGVLETALYVDDPDRSARFYQAVFGFEAIVTIDRLIAMSILGRQVLLLFKKGASLDRETPHDGTGQLHLAFAVAAEELDAWRDHLREQGVAIEAEQVWERGGRSLYFRDPDGHLLEVATPGVWSVY